MTPSESLRALAAAAIYVLIFPPGDPPRVDAPRDKWTGSGQRYEGAEACARALTRNVFDIAARRLGPQEVERAKEGLCVRVD
jgi:hypothetical protein